MSIDGRILDTDNRFYDYCNTFGITNPFQEEQKRFAARCKKEEKYTIIKKESPEDIEWRKEWSKRRDDYLRLSHTFRLWDFHFWMTRTAFEHHLDWSKKYADTSIYMPCDCAERQCSMECAYFLHECPRAKGELKTPEILGFDGRWEYHDDEP